MILSERRVAAGSLIRAEATQQKLTGHAAVFNQLSQDLGGFRERILPSAFSKTIRDDDIRALWNHNPNFVLGRKRAGTLKLKEDSRGLAFEIQPPESAGDMVESIRRKDVDQMGINFRVTAEKWKRGLGDELIRELSEVRLFEISPVTFPAFPGTDVSVAKRSFEREKRRIERTDQMRKKLLELEREVRIDEYREWLQLFISRGARGSELLTVASCAALLASYDLDIPCPRVHVAPADEANGRRANGWASGNEHSIFVCIDLCCCREALTAAHEVRHRWQSLTEQSYSLQSDQLDSFNYEFYFWNKFLRDIVCGSCKRDLRDELPINRYSEAVYSEITGNLCP